MLEEGLMALRQIIERSMTVQTLLDEDSHREILVGGEVKTIDKSRYRRVQLDNLHDLAEFADRYGTDDSAIYVARDKVIFVVTNDARLEWAQMPLKKTSAFSAIEAAHGKSCDQRTLLKLLKIKLDGCVDPAVIESYRRIDVAATSRKVSEMRQTGDKGMSEFKVEAAEATPDTFLVMSHVFVDGGPLQTEAKLRVSIDIDFSATPITFNVSVLRDEIEDAYAEALLSIKQFLVKQIAEMRQAKELIPVFFGSPNL